MRLKKLTALVGVIITGSILLAAANLENIALAQDSDTKIANNCISRKDVMHAQEQDVLLALQSQHSNP